MYTNTIGLMQTLHSFCFHTFVPCLSIYMFVHVRMLNVTTFIVIKLISVDIFNFRCVLFLVYLRVVLCVIILVYVQERSNNNVL